VECLAKKNDSGTTVLRIIIFFHACIILPLLPTLIYSLCLIFLIEGFFEKQFFFYYWYFSTQRISLVNDQLQAQFFYMYLFQFCTCFEQLRAHHQEKKLYQYNIWYMSLCVSDRFVCSSERPAHETVTDTE